VSSPSPSSPDVSLVIETENDQKHRQIRLEHNVAAWRAQTDAGRILEWIVVANRPIRPDEERLLAGLPYRWLVADTGTYYGEKNAGLAVSAGRYVCLADSDDAPEPPWLALAIRSLESASRDVAAITGRTRYQPGPFATEMTVAHFPFQAPEITEVLTIGAGNTIYHGDVLRRLRFRGDHIRHGPDVDLANRMRAEGLRVLYDPALAMTHNYTRNLGDLWGHVAMKGHAFALYADFLKQPRRGALRDGIGRYRVLVTRLFRLRRPLAIPVRRLPLSCAFFLFYTLAAEYGWREAQLGRPTPPYAF
jgi:glycosyltransferase involved in cell wall biosynthesis